MGSLRGVPFLGITEEADEITFPRLYIFHSVFTP